MRAQLGRIQQLVEPALDRREVQVGAFGETTAEHEPRRVERVGQVDQPERHPTGELVDHRQRLGVTFPGRRLDVLAAHERRISAGDLEHPSQPAADGGRAGELGQAGSRREALPASTPAARARWPDRIDDHVAELAGEAVLPDDQPAAGDHAAADARPERDHHEVLDALPGADLPLGVGRCRGVVADGDRPVRAGRPSRPATSSSNTSGTLGEARSTPPRVISPGSPMPTDPGD